MNFCRAIPPKPLADLIESYTYWEGDEPSPELSLKTATCGPSIQINLHSDQLRWYRDTEGNHCQRLNGISVAGPQTRPFAVDSWQAKMVRVVFRPGGAFAFLKLPVAELHNQILSLNEIWGDQAEALQEQLMTAAGPAAIFEHLTTFFVCMLGHNQTTLHPGIALALSHCSKSTIGLSVDELARQANLSRKHFIALFTRTVGVTPKLHLRVIRFQRLQAQLWAHTQMDWADAAAAHGYYDQSHLIRDFKQFTGMPPQAFFSLYGGRRPHG